MMQKKIKKERWIIIHEWKDSKENFKSDILKTSFSKEESAKKYIRKQKNPHEYFTQKVFK